jgi:hypothetical protein
VAIRKVAFLENAIALLSKNTFPVSASNCVFLKCFVLKSGGFDSICRLIFKDQQHAPVLPFFSTSWLTLEGSGSSGSAVTLSRTPVTLSYTCSDFTRLPITAIVD